MADDIRIPANLVAAIVGGDADAVFILLADSELSKEATEFALSRLADIKAQKSERDAVEVAVSVHGVESLIGDNSHELRRAKNFKALADKLNPFK